MKIEIDFLEVTERIIFKAGFKKFIQDLIRTENKKLGEIHIILTGNTNILEINRTFLNHNYFTDVIAFANNKRNTLSGDIYISIDQVIMNSKIFKVTFKDELARVIIHGFLHLIGYNDKMEEEITIMHKKEDHYLCLLKEQNLIAEREVDL